MVIKSSFRTTLWFQGLICYIMDRRSGYIVVSSLLEIATASFHVLASIYLLALALFGLLGTWLYGVRSGEFEALERRDSTMYIEREMFSLFRFSQSVDIFSTLVYRNIVFWHVSILLFRSPTPEISFLVGRHYVMEVYLYTGFYWG